MSDKSTGRPDMGSNYYALKRSFLIASGLLLIFSLTERPPDALKEYSLLADHAHVVRLLLASTALYYGVAFILAWRHEAPHHLQSLSVSSRILADILIERSAEMKGRAGQIQSSFERLTRSHAWDNIARALEIGSVPVLDVGEIGETVSTVLSQHLMNLHVSVGAAGWDDANQAVAEAEGAADSAALGSTAIMAVSAPRQLALDAAGRVRKRTIERMNFDSLNVDAVTEKLLAQLNSDQATAAKTVSNLREDIRSANLNAQIEIKGGADIIDQGLQAVRYADLNTKLRVLLIDLIFPVGLALIAILHWIGRDFFSIPWLWSLTTISDKIQILRHTLRG